METRKKQKNTNKINNLSNLNGTHPIQREIPEIAVNYRARKRSGGKIVYFNLELAKEMGLINDDVSKVKEVEKEVLETFSIQIINEYDIENNVKYAQKDILDHHYMATRYLQLQHRDNIGLESGDGRTVWNGQVVHNNRAWDVSSAGVGGTRLSPATNKYQKFFQTGDPSISYGCGLSEVSEGLETLLFSEVLHATGIKTERALATIEFPDGFAINVRAYECLLRPSHFFRPLKQGNYLELRKIFDYYYKFITQYKGVSFKKKREERYEQVLDIFTTDFARTSALFESEYIFCWLDWDGDNILMDGGIIDYGSVRQFGLFHHEYKYDDVDRYSTNIKEQKSKAAYMVSTFHQAIDFLKTSKKRPIKKFLNSSNIKKFNKIFEATKQDLLLEKTGLDFRQKERIIKSKSFKNFEKAYRYFEMKTSHEGVIELPDGITRNAIYCMRDFLREMPKLLILDSKNIDIIKIHSLMLSNYANKKDSILTTYKRKKLNDLIRSYKELVIKSAKSNQMDISNFLSELNVKSSFINKYEKITGDSISHIVHYLQNTMKEKLCSNKIEEVIEHLKSQSSKSVLKKHYEHNRPSSKIIHIQNIIQQNREGI